MTGATKPSHFRIAYVPAKSRDLGPKQLAWLKKNVAKFAYAKDQADDALAHTAKVAREIEGKK